MADLPDDPDLGWLRKAAKRLRREHPEWPLHEAQLQLARGYGFPSWNGLVRHVELVRRYRRTPDRVPEQADPVAELLRLGCLTYGADEPDRRARAGAMLAAEPGLGRDDPYVAAARCDVPALRRLLAADPAAATREGGPFEWPPLLYLAYARIEPPPSEAATLEAAGLLLEHGADPGARYLWHGHEPFFTALTGCFGEGEQGPGNQPAHPHGAALARLLLAAGADPNDEQTLYNRMFERDDSHLELLLAHGLDVTRLGGQLAWAAVHGLDERIRLLAARGVDLDAPLGEYGAGGHRAVELARLAGCASTAALLVDLGAAPPALSPALAVVAAVLAGEPVDETQVPAAIAARPGLVAWAAGSGDAGAVRRAVGLGWDVDRLARTDVPSDQPWESGLHVAAGNGDLALVELLLELGADPAVTDHRFGATPAGWAEHFGHSEVLAVLHAADGNAPDPRG